MEITEMMKRYEAETGESLEEAKANVSDEAIEAFQEIIRTQCDEISVLKAQLTWRPVSDSPKKDGEYFVITADGDINKMYFNQGYWFIWDDEVSGYFLPMLPPRKWLPIPPDTMPDLMKEIIK